MKPTQLKLPLDIPTGSAHPGHIIDRIKESSREAIPEGSIVRTKQISIKHVLR